MNEKVAADGRKSRITHSQIKKKVKILVCEWKSISLSQWTASGIYQVEKGFRKWWDILFLLVGSWESADLPNVVEPSFYNDNKNNDLENDLGGSKNAIADKKSERIIVK